MEALPSQLLRRWKKASKILNVASVLARLPHRERWDIPALHCEQLLTNIENSNLSFYNYLSMYILILNLILQVLFRSRG